MAKKVADKSTEAKKKGKKAEKANDPAVMDLSAEGTPGTEAEEKAKAPKVARVRGKRYVAARAMVDKTHLYTAEEAVALAKKTNFARFAGSLEAHLVLRDEGLDADVTFPYTTGKTLTVAIATDELIEKITKGVIEFDVLVAHPSFMPKLAKVARVLGPKGLMPNPKNKTITPDPEKRKKELEGGTTTVRAEKKAPLSHAILGKLSQPDKELVENLNALLAAYPNGKVVKCVIAASMGPGIKVKVS